MLETSVFPTLLAFATIVFGLSLLVQVFQEVYKSLTSSKSKTYVKALLDFLGPHAAELLKPGSITELQVRGPFQFLRRRPTGRLQPMERPELMAALERTSAPWIRRTLDALHLDAELHTNGPKESRKGPSPALRELFRQLDGVERGSPGYATAVEVRQFIDTWLRDEDGGSPDAAGLLLAIRRRFLPLVAQVETHFGQFMKNFELTYRRRNLRQTFLIGLGIAVLFQMPTDRLYRRAGKVPIDQAIASAEGLMDIYATEAARTGASPRGLEELRPVIDSLTAELTRAGAPLGESFSMVRLGTEFASVQAGGQYLFWCAVTALLISFGAPFWNDLTGALLRLNRGPGPARITAPPEET